MNLTTRKTYAFIEIKVDEIQTTVFKSDTKEINSVIQNLLCVASDLASYTNMSIEDYVKQGDF